MTREVQLDAAVASAPAAQRTDVELGTAESEAEQARIGSLVQRALSELPAEDQAIVRMRFWDDFGVAEIARALQLEQKPLYRRLEAIQATLAAALARLGLGRSQVAEMLTREGGAE
jgi:RNA polymerase sigma factor for flagellar operon FliA